MLVADAHLLWKTSRAHIGRFGTVTDGQRRRRHCIIGFSISFISLWRVDWRRRQPSEPSHYTLERRKKNSIIRRPITTTLFRLKCEPNLQAEVKEQWAILKLKETSKKKFPVNRLRNWLHWLPEDRLIFTPKLDSSSLVVCYQSRASRMKKFSRLDIVGIAYKFSHCHRVSSTWTSFFSSDFIIIITFFFLCAIESRHSAFCMTAKINMLEASQWLDMCRIGLCHCCVWCSLWWHGRHRIGIGLEGNFIIVPRKKREKMAGKFM